MIEEYFIWLTHIVCDRSSAHRYSLLLEKLFETEFTWKIPLDANRAKDGLNLRRDYIYEFNLNYWPEDLETTPCSILEVMIALASRCEIDIMNDPDIGNRAPEWFWEMIESLELIEMTNDNFNDDYVDWILARFLNREYEPNGRGSLFTINRHVDMRRIEIWYQLQYYLNEKVQKGVIKT